MYKISIPKGAKAIILGLRYENHEAYIVGGCVRDSLLGKEPKDWDICTSATPQEVKEHLNRCSVRTIDTGLKHGTITADMERAGKYEITTFRIDGDYSDNRRPDSVTFTESIYQDLSCRDFTINAMAYNSAGLIDPFHGVDDLKNGIIRCVGNQMTDSVKTRFAFCVHCGLLLSMGFQLRRIQRRPFMITHGGLRILLRKESTANFASCFSETEFSCSAGLF